MGCVAPGGGIKKCMSARGRSRWSQGLRRGSATVPFAGIAGSNPAGDMVFSVVSVGCYQIEFSALG